MINLEPFNGTVYMGTKTIEAKPMTLGDYNKYKGWTIPANENPDTEGYMVAYSDNYISWSPKEAFEASYRSNGHLTYGQAIEALKQGKQVYRKGWNGKDMYIELVRAHDFEFSELLPFFVIKNVKNSLNTWVASVSDTLAEDWCIRGEELDCSKRMG